MLTKDASDIIKALKAGENLIPSGYERITVTGGSPQALDLTTSGKGLDACYAEISVESTVAAPCARYKLYGTVTTSDGLQLSNLDFITFDNSDSLSAIRFIATSGTTKLNVQYYKKY